MVKDTELLQEDELEIDLKELFGNLLDNWKLIAITTVLTAIIGILGTALFITPQYKASVNMIVNSRQDSTGSLTNDNITSSKNLISTYAVILKSNIILNEVIEELELEDTYKELSEKITVAAIDSTQVMEVAVEYPDPAVAYQIVEKLVDIAPEVIVDAVEAGSCKVVSQVTVGDEPVSPSMKKNAVLAALIGMVLSMGIVVLKVLFRNYILDDEDVAKYLGLPVLAVIPEIEEG